MDKLDFRFRFSPIVTGVPLRYSVAAYRGRKRVVIAWFADEGPANDYLARCRRTNPSIKFDCLRSFF